MEQKYIYVVFSATPYFIGKAIRKVTKETYNHVSIALDAELSQLYGFARRYYRTPFYGGFVRESLSRYHVRGKSTQVCICKLPVTTSQYVDLETRLEQMFADRDTYIYNHISALGGLIRKPIRAKNAYTCVEFCVDILHSLNFGTDPDMYYSVGDLEQLLRPYGIYTGDMYPCKGHDAIYYAKHPVPFPGLITLRELCKLLPRLANK